MILVVALFSISICAGLYGRYKIIARFKDNEHRIDVLESMVNTMYDNSEKRIIEVKRQTIYFKAENEKKDKQKISI
jgi:hypothetical protein